MKRRHILSTGFAATLTASQSLAQSSDTQEFTQIGERPPLPSDLQSLANEPAAPYVGMEPVGTAQPNTVEIDRAYQILINSPFGSQTAPIDVASYLLEVGRGSQGADNRPFLREWPVRANPLIYHMFASTTTKPEGDSTPWCAAFVNWCILRSHASTADQIGHSPGGFSKAGRPFDPAHLTRYSTNNASSGSFRCWDEGSPVRGAVAVFANAGTGDMTAVCRGTGHVGFVYEQPSPTAGNVSLLSGNSAQAGSNGAVTLAIYRTTPGSRFMKFVSLKSS